MNGKPQQNPGQDMSRLAGTAAMMQLLQSKDTKRMMELLQSQGGVQSAAQAAAKGDSAQLMAMMQQLMGTDEGAKLVERITKQAQQAGL